MNEKIDMDEILISVYVKIPMNTTAQKLYENLLLVVIVDSSTGVIKQSEITFAANIAKKFIADILEGTNLNDDIESLVSLVERKYFGHLKKSLISALRMLHREYSVIVQGRRQK